MLATTRLMRSPLPILVCAALGRTGGFLRFKAKETNLVLLIASVG